MRASSDVISRIARNIREGNISAVVFDWSTPTLRTTWTHDTDGPLGVETVDVTYQDALHDLADRALRKRIDCTFN